MLEWMHDADITRHLRLDGSSATLASCEAFIEQAKVDGTDLHRAIADSTDTYMGTISLKDIDLTAKRAEYAICLHADALGKGVARAATGGILDIAFGELGLKTVYLNVLEENIRAWKFYEKYGFRYTHSTSANIHGKEKALRWYEVNA